MDTKRLAPFPPNFDGLDEWELIAREEMARLRRALGDPALTLVQAVSIARCAEILEHEIAAHIRWCDAWIAELRRSARP